MPNAVSGFDRFIEQWDSTKAARTCAELGDTEEQINLESSPACESAAIFVPSDEGFLAALEPGVRPLVLSCVRVLDCVTYTSCQGHRAPDPGQRFRPRHVGIVPRNEQEHRFLLDVLQRCAARSHAALPGAATSVAVVETTLEVEGGPRPCLDLFFVPEGLDEDSYFRDVDQVTEAFLLALGSHGE